MDVEIVFSDLIYPYKPLKVDSLGLYNVKVDNRPFNKSEIV